MRLLLDTHALLWWLGDAEDLGATARQEIQDNSAVLVSVVTGVEIAIKSSVGKLTIPEGLAQEIDHQGFEVLELTWRHAETLSELPLHHRDPFDRMLIAQAVADDLRVVTADQAFTAYDVPLLDART